MYDRKSFLRSFDEHFDIKFVLDQDFAKNRISCTKINKDILVMDNVLTDEECDLLTSFNHYKSMENEYDKKIRGNDRFLSMSWYLSHSIFERIKDFIPTKGKPFGFGVDGEWNVSGINDCMRFSRYVAPNVGFLPHRDAAYIGDPNNRSIYTILIYLNDNFEGGYTKIYKEPGGRVPGETVEEEIKGKTLETLYSMKPKKGSLLIFNHNMIHEGTSVESGTKYIIRTDLVFTRDVVPKVCETAYWMEDLMFIKSIDTYREANNQETNGNILEAGELYERALSYRQCSEINKN